MESQPNAALDLMAADSERDLDERWSAAHPPLPQPSTIPTSTREPRIHSATSTTRLGYPPPDWFSDPEHG